MPPAISRNPRAPINSPDEAELKPADEVARRERSFVLASDGQYQRALPDLERYVHRHPRDAMGFYELAIAQAYVDRGKALEALDHAPTLDALLTPPRYTPAVPVI